MTVGMDDPVRDVLANANANDMGSVGHELACCFASVMTDAVMCDTMGR